MREQPPRFSIVIPVYNAGLVLKECLYSILAQTNSDWECICVDDGSTDGSSAILDDFAARDPRFRVVHQDNAGPSTARNHGLAVAKGEWVSFVDADDWVDVDYLDSFARSRRKADINFTGSRFVWQNGDCHDYVLPCQEFVTDVAAIGEACQRLAYNETGRNLFGYSVNKFIRRDLIEGHGVRFPEELYACEDEIFMLQACRRVRTLAISPQTHYNYRLTDHGLTARPDKPHEQMTRHYREVMEQGVAPGIKRLCRTRIYEEMYWQAIECRAFADIRRLREFCRSCSEGLASVKFKWRLIAGLARLPSPLSLPLLVTFFIVAHWRYLRRKSRSGSIWGGK